MEVKKPFYFHLIILNLVLISVKKSVSLVYESHGYEIITEDVPCIFQRFQEGIGILPQESKDHRFQLVSVKCSPVTVGFYLCGLKIEK